MTIDLGMNGNGFSDDPEVSLAEGAVTRMPATNLGMAARKRPTLDFVMAGFVPANHDLLAARHRESRGWPRRARP